MKFLKSQYLRDLIGLVAFALVLVAIASATYQADRISDLVP
jgi:hypothetical protein